MYFNLLGSACYCIDFDGLFLLMFFVLLHDFYAIVQEFSPPFYENLNPSISSIYPQPAFFSTLAAAQAVARWRERAPGAPGH